MWRDDVRGVADFESVAEDLGIKPMWCRIS